MYRDSGAGGLAEQPAQGSTCNSRLTSRTAIHQRYAGPASGKHTEINALKSVIKRLEKATSKENKTPKKAPPKLRSRPQKEGRKKGK